MSTKKRFIIKKRSISDALGILPPLLPLREIKSELDFFICVCGFEERVLAIPRFFLEGNTRINKGIFLGNYKTNPEDNNKRKSELLPILESLNNNIVTFEAENPENILNILSAVEAGHNGETSINIGLDISGGSSTFITSTIIALTRLKIDVHLSIFYTTAEDYHEPTDASLEEPVSVWKACDLRETGVDDVSANELVPGIQHDHLPSFVIAIPSMFPARLQRGLSFLGIGTLSGADENIYWILPSTDHAKHKWRQSQVKKSLLDMIYGAPEHQNPQQDLPEAQWSFCDVLDYQGCARHILNQTELREGTNISIIHAGTKIQAVGVALALSARPEIALVKSRPQSFSAAHYSTGTGTPYVIELTKLKSIIQSLAAIGSFDIESN